MKIDFGLRRDRKRFVARLVMAEVLARRHGPRRERGPLARLTAASLTVAPGSPAPAASRERRS